MLTRLEVSGFKNLHLAMELGPLNVVVGPGGVGKSNLFDAVELLAALAVRPFAEAFAAVRGGHDGAFADPREPIRIAAEMIVAPTVRDDFGRTAEATTSFLRYELALGFGAGGVALHHESLDHITQGDAARHLRFPHRAATFRRSAILGRRSGEPFVSTREGAVRLHQDAGGRGLVGNLADADRTVVCATCTVNDPTVLAARREMASWRRVDLGAAPAGRDGETARRLGALAATAPTGLVCFEEPEAHVFPGRFAELAAGIAALGVDPRRAVGADNPLRQVWVSTHAPALAQFFDSADLLLADPGPRGPILRPVARTWRAREGELGVSRAVLLRGMTAAGGQLPLV